MIKILDHTKPLTQLVNDTTNGLGKIDPLECLVTEELNGIYEAQIVILQTDKHFKDIALNGLLEINAGEVIGNQIFRIYFISKPIDFKILIKCQHISYDLSKVAVKPFNATGAVNTKNKLLENIMGTYPFDMMTDINNSTTYFSLDVPKSFRECLGGWEGSVLDKFRCEYEWDNLLVKMLATRGSDNGVRIAYGKNLTDFQQEENIQNVFTSVLGYAVVNEQTYVGNIYHKIVSNLPKVKIVDFSNDFGDTPPTTAQLTQKAQEYATNNSIEVPDVSINISFVPLYQTEEYKNIAPLERVALGDTVHVFFDKLGVEATSRVVKTVWNAVLNKYDSVELGNTRANLTTLLDDAVQEAKENITIDAGFIETEMNDMSQLIINGLGLHRTLVPLSTGGHRMYLHNKPTLAESDTQYVIAAEGFMISRDYGQTWNSGWDADGNAVVNSLATITLKALEIYGSYLCFGDYPNGKYIEASTYSNSSSVQQGVSFDGSGTIRMQPQDTFIVNNMTSGGNFYNQIVLNKQYNSENTNNAISLRNYDDTQNYIVANFIQLDAHYTYNGATYNRTIWHNYATHTGTSVSANLIMMEARDGNSFLYLNNRKQSGTNLANQIQFSYSTTQNNLYLRNYNQGANSIGNLIQLQTTANSGISLIRNHKVGTTNYANTISAETAATYNRVVLTNYFLSEDKQANSLTLAALSGSRQINLYQYDSGYVSNNISLYASATQRNISIKQNSINTEERINELLLTYNPTNESSSVYLYNGKYYESSSLYSPINNISMNASSSDTNSIYIRNRNNSGKYNNAIELKAASTSSNELNINNYITGTRRNYIEMKAGTTNSIFIRNNATTASRYNELEMSDGGNFNLYSSDDMNLKAMDICRVQGVNTLVLASTDVQLWIGGTQVSLYLSGGYVRYS